MSLHRTYVALVEGEVTEPEGVIKSYIYESKALVMHTTRNPGEGRPRHHPIQKTEKQ